jgi:hypothetical protein
LLVSTASVFLTFFCLVLGIICRLNFGKGLLRYRKSSPKVARPPRLLISTAVNAHESLPGDDFVPITRGGDLEKVSFPSNEKPVPTFSGQHTSSCTAFSILTLYFFKSHFWIWIRSAGALADV